MALTEKNIDVSLGVTNARKEASASQQSSGKYSSKNSARWFLGFGIFSLIISLGFFFEGMRANYSSLSGDQINILTVVIKKDHPNLLQNDLVVGDARSVDYYIPFFVNTIRLLSLPDQNYLRGLNLLLLFTSLIYMFGWCVLFSVWGNRWIAGVIAFLVRGIMWPPGNELWGIAGIWSMLPRTLFLALLPWVLWLWFRKRRTRAGWYLTCLLCGLISNIHPISGVCIVAALALGEFAWTWAEEKSLGRASLKVAGGGLLMLLGLSPFIWTYLVGLGSAKGIDAAEFYQAMHMRIGSIFWDPRLYVEAWLRPKWLMFIFLPWLGLLLLPRKTLKANKNAILALAAFYVGCVVTSLGPFIVEHVLNRMGHQARFAFQLVRTGKYIMVPSLVITAFLLTVAWQHIASRIRNRMTVGATIISVVLGLTLVSRYPVFDRVPLLGDDVVRYLWPRLAGPLPFSEQMGGVLAWARDNTPEDAKFIGPRIIRVGAQRPVIYDFAGAGMLIEGNPELFIEAARKKRQFESPEYSDPARRAELLSSWGGDYWVTKMKTPELRLAYADAGWYVYDIREQRKAIE